MSVRQQLGVVGGGSPSCARKQRLELGHGITDRQDKTRELIADLTPSMWPTAAAVPGNREPSYAA